MAETPSVAGRTEPGAIAWVLPFALFAAFLALQSIVPVPQWLRLVLEVALFLTVSRPTLRTRPIRPWWSVALGVAVFAIWVGPDQIFPHYRQWLPFHNSIVGRAIGTTPEAERHNAVYLTFRVLVSVAAVPVLEELFWRGFLMRWLIDRDFRAVRLGTYAAGAFWIVAILFASEHGPYWDVGLATGVIYNWWMVRNGNLWDCIIAHSVTNACLAAFVISAGQWQYWL